jgi:hypothetical protein
MHTGKTQCTTSPEDPDLSVTTLVDDFVYTLRAVWPQPGAAPTVLVRVFRVLFSLWFAWRSSCAPSLALVLLKPSFTLLLSNNQY